MARALRHYGQTDTYFHTEIGLNSRLDELHAAVLHRVFLPRLDAWTARRVQIATAYRCGLATSRVDIPPIPPESHSVWHLFPVLVTPEGRTDFRAHLKARGIATGVHYPFVIPDQLAMKKYGTFKLMDDLSNARKFAACEVSLPIHPFMTDHDVDDVIAAVLAWR